MKRISTTIIVLASLAGAGFAYAQDVDAPSASETTSQKERSGKRFNRSPVDLEQFSRLETLKAADKNGDGTLDREEIEAYALKLLVQRMADRMERRLDVNRDGTITISEVEAQKAKEFAALDRNEDGKLDWREMRVSKMSRSFGKRGEGHPHRMHRHW